MENQCGIIDRTPVGVQHGFGEGVTQRLKQPAAHAASGAACDGVRHDEALQAVAVARLPLCDHNTGHFSLNRLGRKYKQKCPVDDARDGACHDRALQAVVIARLLLCGMSGMQVREAASD